MACNVLGVAWCNGLSVGLFYTETFTTKFLRVGSNPVRANILSNITGQNMADFAYYWGLFPTMLYYPSNTTEHTAILINLSE